MRHYEPGALGARLRRAGLLGAAAAGGAAMAGGCGGPAGPPPLVVHFRAAASHYAQLLAGPATGDLGGAVSAEGDLLAVGAPYEYGGIGAVHLFSRTGEGWSAGPVLVLARGEERADGRLGTSVAWWGARVAAGAPQAGRDHSGRVVIFTRAGRRWVQSVALRGADHPQSFGQSVAVARGRLAVGAPQGFGPGQAYVFVPRATPAAREWSAVEMRGAGTTANPAPYDGFGTSVAFMASSAVVGAPDQGPAGMLYVRRAAAAPARRR